MSDKKKVANDDHATPAGEAVNTKAMKLLKTDDELIQDAHDAMDMLIYIMKLLQQRKIYLDLGIDNGLGPKGKPTLLTFVARKTLEQFVEGQ